MKKYKVGINGLGRIGRAILRITLNRTDIEVVAVNDINPDINNLAYLIKYDTTYGKLPYSVVSKNNEKIVLNNEREISIYQHAAIDQVPWSNHDVDLVIDASGVASNLDNSRKLSNQSVAHCIVTNAPDQNKVDAAIIMGANENSFIKNEHFLVSSSICDANAFVPVAKLLDENFGIEHGFITTLHPWLNYQNLLDGPSISYATPGQIHDYYALGRGSTDSLIPKTTSAVKAAQKVLPHLEGKFLSMSYRVPTMIVSSADISMQLKNKTQVQDVINLFEETEKKQKWKTIYNNKEALVSIDFKGNEYSAIVDHRWIMMNDQNYLKMVLWYDNEWGYSYSVVELIDHIKQQYE